ncbi:unnamed protein product [Mortierella alpina]
MALSTGTLSYFHCRRGLVDKKIAFEKQKSQLRLGALIPRHERLPKLSANDMVHLLNFHSSRQVRIHVRTTETPGTSVYLSRRPDKNMALICICGNEYWSRISLQKHYLRQCANTPIPPGTAGISYQDGYEDQNEDGDEGEDGEIEEEEGESEDDEEYVDWPADSCNINSNINTNTNCNCNSHSNSNCSSAVRSFGAEFVKAIETTRSLQRQSQELHLTAVNQLLELHQASKKRIRELRQEVHEERTTRRLALQALLETQATHQEERQEWTVERLSLQAYLETQQKERQETEERISSIESRLKRSIMALGDDIAPYRTPSTSEDSVLAGIKKQCVSPALLN